MVTLSILAIAAAVTLPALRDAVDTPPTVHGRIAAARREALEQGHAVALAVRDSTGVRLFTAWPDGRVTADTALGVDPLNGRPRARP